MRSSIDPAESFVTGDAVAVRHEEARLRSALAVLERENERLRRTVQKLEREVERDDLTPLYNRRYFDVALVRHSALSRRHGISAAVVYIDVDNLKRINDAHGHAAGDAVLREIATRLLGAVRASDTCARIGGDEFALILDHTTEPAARLQIDRLIALLATGPMSFGAVELPLSASFGLAMLRADDDSATVLDAADRDMYRNKSASD